MPGVSQILYCAMQLSRELIQGQRILDVGSCDYNGSIRPLIESWSPSEYIGVDVIPGKGVDRVAGAEELIKIFGTESFDIIICLEMLEHAKYWKACISNMKSCLKPGGLLILSTRSVGFPCHGFPHDYWRYELADMRQIFSDFEVNNISSDPTSPGVFLCARKPTDFHPCDLSKTALYSVLTGKRQEETPEELLTNLYYLRLALKQTIKSLASFLFISSGRLISKLLRL